MARIGAAELERLKRDTDLAELVRSSGVELEQRGKDLVGRCPFHDDATPSLHVSREKNLWHCLGACQAGGSVIDWVMKTKRVSFIHAVEQLRAGLGASPGGPTVRPLPAVVSITADDQQLLDDVCGYYHQTLKESVEAQEYLRSRGLWNAELVEAFKLGFANRTLGLRMPSKQVKAGAEMRERLQKVGILRESGHEHLNGSLVVPILDENGHVMGMYGRKVTERLREGTPLHLYLPGPHRGVFNVAGVRGHDEVVVCEALIDALTLWNLGIRNVTSAYGVAGVTEELLASLVACKRVLIAFDADDAGDAGAEKFAERLVDMGVAAFRVVLPRGMDINEVARGSTAAAEEMGHLLAQARPMVAVSSVAAPAPTSTAPATTVEAPKPVSPRPVGFGVEVVEGDYHFTFGTRRYRVRGLHGNNSVGVMKVSIKATRDDAAEAMHIDSLDLVSHAKRTGFVRQAAVELGVPDDVTDRDMRQMFDHLESAHESRLREKLQPRKAKEVEISPADEAAALALLRDGKLVERIVADFEACGVVGERTNVLVGYLAAVSRLLRRPLGVMVMSGSAAGKSSLMDSVLAFVPEEQRIKFSSLTPQALYYMRSEDVRHKVMALVEEQGAEQSSYALKLLQSEGELTIASTGKDSATGVLETRQYHVEGPVALFVTTTSPRPDEELMNRCLVLTVNESREQTRKIHQLQRERRTEAGLARDVKRAEVLQLHQNAQRLLKPLAVVNNLAPRLTFLDDKTRTRRDHEKYLSLMEAVALLRQHQKPRRVVVRDGVSLECVDVTLEDVALANELASDVLGRSLDELYPQDRKLLELLCEMVGQICARDGVERQEVLFTRREVREYTRWTEWQVREHLQRLVDLEYVVPRRSGNGLQHVYELMYAGGGDDGGKFLMGLSMPTTAHPEPQKRHPEPTLSPGRAHLEPGLSPGHNGKTPHINGQNPDTASLLGKGTTGPNSAERIVSYAQGREA